MNDDFDRLHAAGSQSTNELATLRALCVLADLRRTVMVMRRAIEDGELGGLRHGLNDIQQMVYDLKMIIPEEDA